MGSVSLTSIGEIKLTRAYCHDEAKIDQTMPGGNFNSAPQRPPVYQWSAEFIPQPASLPLRNKFRAPVIGTTFVRRRISVVSA
jgi:hypothetical protein